MNSCGSEEGEGAQDLCSGTTRNFDSGSGTHYDEKKNRSPRFNIYEIRDAQLVRNDVIILQ